VGAEVKNRGSRDGADDRGVEVGGAEEAVDGVAGGPEARARLVAVGGGEFELVRAQRARWGGGEEDLEGFGTDAGAVLGAGLGASELRDLAAGGSDGGPAAAGRLRGGRAAPHYGQDRRKYGGRRRGNGGRGLSRYGVGSSRVARTGATRTGEQRGERGGDRHRLLCGSGISRRRYGGRASLGHGIRRHRIRVGGAANGSSRPCVGRGGVAAVGGG